MLASTAKESTGCFFSHVLHAAICSRRTVSETVRRAV